MPLPPLRSPVWPVAALVALIGLGFVPHSFLFGDTDWELVYIPAAQRMRAGESIFQQAFVYPPAAALLALPASYLSPKAVQISFWLMQTAFGSLLLLGGWALTGGRFRWLPPARECAIALLGVLASIGYVFDVMVNRQTDLVVGGLVVGGCLLLRGNRNVAGGTLVGIAAGLKCTPLLFVPYLALVGKWRAAVTVAAVAVAVNFVPDVLFPPPDGTPRVVTWAKDTFGYIGDTSRKPGEWHANIGFNHSLAGAANRLTTTRQGEIDGRWNTLPREPLMSPNTLRVFVYGVSLALLAVAAVVVARRRMPLHPFDIGMALCLMVLLSPMSSKPHFCVLAVPAWAVARSGRWGFAVAAALLALPANKDLMGGWAYDWILWHGIVPLEALVLFAGCAVARWPDGDFEERKKL